MELEFPRSSGSENGKGAAGWEIVSSWDTCEGTAAVLQWTELVTGATIAAVSTCSSRPIEFDSWSFLSPSAGILLCCGHLVRTPVAAMFGWDVPFLLWVALFFCPLHLGVLTSAILVKVPVFYF